MRTLSDVTETPPRERIALRVNQAQLTAARRLAAEETEGNVSLMLRKLIDEALRAREAATTHR